MRVLLYQIYGGQRAYHLELTYGILSAARFLQDDPAGIRIILAADRDNCRPDLPVEHLLMTPTMLNEWQMDGTYSHAIQAYALHYAVNHFDAPVILIDSDTVFRSHPKELFERIAPGKTIMHAREGKLSESPEWSEWSALIKRTKSNASKWPIRPESVMYNAGVLGIHPANAALMNDVKVTMRMIRDNSDMFTAVQLAASVVFQKSTKISTCDDIVDHYWCGPRPYYRYQMQEMFPSVLDGVGVCNAKAALPPLREFPRVPIHLRLAARVKRWQRAAGPEYGAAYLAYLSALSLRGSNPKLANVWATIAMDMLTWSVKGCQPQPRDFVRFTNPSLDQQAWMQADLRRRWRNYWPGTINCNESSPSR